MYGNESYNSEVMDKNTESQKSGNSPTKKWYIPQRTSNWKAMEDQEASKS